MSDVPSNEELTPGKGYRRYDIHEGIIFCIELSNGMFDELPELNYNIQLVEILETLDQLMSQLVITRPSTGIGCYFFNCNRFDAKDKIYPFLPLKDVNAQNMKKLSDLLEDLQYERTTLRQFLSYDASKHTPLESLLELVREEFVKDVPDQKAFNNKKIFYFTDNDSPPEAADIDAKSRLRHLVNDLDDRFINFTTFFIGKPGLPFDERFYSDILRLGATTKAGDEFDGPNTTPISAAYIKSRVLRKQEIKRIMFQCPLILEEKSKFIIGVKGYTIISHEKPGVRYKLVYENEDIRQEAYSRRKYLNAKTGEEIKDGLTKVYPYGDLDIELSESDIAEIRNDYAGEESFLKVIGFQSTETCLHYYNNIEKATFVVPDEGRYEGSIRTLSSLFKNLRQKNKVAIVWGKLKSNSNPAIFIFCPSDEASPNEGFYLYRVPFLDELRRIPPMLISHGEIQVDDYENLKEVTKKIINHFNLKNGFEPSEFKNPGLQKHFKILHDYLLQIEEEPEKDDVEWQRSKLLEEDDSLRRISQIRDKIDESANSKDPNKQKLSKYLAIWNSLYDKIFDQEIAIADAPKTKKKRLINI